MDPQQRQYLHHGHGHHRPPQRESTAIARDTAFAEIFNRPARRAQTRQLQQPDAYPPHMEHRASMYSIASNDGRRPSGPRGMSMSDKSLPPVPQQNRYNGYGSPPGPPGRPMPGPIPGPPPPNGYYRPGNRPPDGRYDGRLASMPSHLQRNSVAPNDRSYSLSRSPRSFVDPEDTSQWNDFADQHRPVSSQSTRMLPHVPGPSPLFTDVDFARQAQNASPESPSSPTAPSAKSMTSLSSTLVSETTNSPYSGNLPGARKSAESVRVMPTQPKNDAANDRSWSFSGISTNGSTRRSTDSAIVTTSRRAPIVYPALLSRVADAFRQRISLSERVKDGLTYKEAFDGREAVEKIAWIIKTTDRNLALLLGRALDAQKFFHDVTYDHRLRDSPHEIYQFKERLTFAPSDEDAQITDNGEPLPSPDDEMPEPVPEPKVQDDPADLPNGVFTLLTDCYSPTCTRDRLCYSIACPRRLEQQARLNMKPQPGLKRSMSRGSLSDKKETKLWSHSVSQEILDSVTDKEKKRQEAINEVIYTERDFVKDLEYLRDVWMIPLSQSTIIAEARRDQFIHQVFFNVLEVHAVNSRLAELLTQRQKQRAVVSQIGDIFLELVPHFDPFIKYGSHQLYGKYEFEREKGNNPAFAKFVEEVERLPESRKLELNGYLTKPTTRLARYPLLLEAVLKQTEDDNPDKVTIPKVVSLIREFLGRVNVESGKSENRFNLLQLDQQLVFRSGEAVDLKLTDADRELIFKGTLKKRSNTQSESSDLQVFLFDHALLMVKVKLVNKREQYKVHRKPIPLELLTITTVDETSSASKSSKRPQSILPKSGTAKGGTMVARSDARGYAITFTHLGRKGYSMTLWATTYVSRRKWIESIDKQQQILRERSKVFDTVTLSERFFIGGNKVTCACIYDNGLRIVYGTDSGVYVSDRSDPVPTKVMQLQQVTQIEVLEDLLLVLAEKQVTSYPLEALDPNDTTQAIKRTKKISGHTSFFKSGVCLNKMLVCVVKSSSLSSTIKTLEPVAGRSQRENKATFRRLLQGGNADSLKVFKEFYIPTESTSVHFLKSKLCVGCTKGFEIVDLKTLETQGLLDPADSSLDFVQRRENVKPIAIYRLRDEFLLCYDEFAFYVNRNGWRARISWIINWEGTPTSFALHEPYVLAFEPTFVEIRHVDTGHLMQIIPGHNLKCLYSDPSMILFSSEDKTTDTSSIYELRLAPLGAPEPYVQEQYDGYYE